MAAGPKGLLVAKFSDRVHTTELCNLMLAAAPMKRIAKKRPAAGDIAKKPAAAAAVEAPEVAAPPEEMAAAVPAAPAVAKNDYGIMYYKKDRSIGIRAKFGACNTVLSFGGSKCTKTEKELRDIAKQIVSLLHNGVSVPEAKKRGVELAVGA